MEQIQMIDFDNTYENEQKKFDEFLAAQNGKFIPSMSDVLFEANGIRMDDLRRWYADHTVDHPNRDADFKWFCLHIQRYIETHDVQLPLDVMCQKALSSITSFESECHPASIPHGYIGAAAPSATAANSSGDVSFTRRDLVIYKEQNPFEKQTSLPYSAVRMPQKLDEYTFTNTNGLHGADYSIAFTDQTPTLEDAIQQLCPMLKQAACLDVCDAMFHREVERETFDAEHSQHVVVSVSLTHPAPSTPPREGRGWAEA
jgi:hypothetical protein